MISAQIRAQVRRRAQNAYEYCHLHQVPRQRDFNVSLLDDLVAIGGSLFIVSRF